MAKTWVDGNNFVNVELNVCEMQYAATVAIVRKNESDKMGLKDANGFDRSKYPVLPMELEGVAAEIAVAASRNVYFDASYNTFKQADVGVDGQVRYSFKDHGRLIVRKKDNPDHCYVLVTGQMPHMIIRGWMYGHEAMKDGYLDTPQRRPPAWFVPQEDLRPWKLKAKA